MVDARKYAPKYVMADDVRDASIKTRIVTVFEDDRYGRLMLELETGSQFGLNQTNTAILIKAWGNNTDDWHGQEIEFLLGTYPDWKDGGAEKETVKVRAVAPANPADNGSTPAAKPLPPSRVPPKDDFDDSIPF